MSHPTRISTAAACVLASAACLGPVWLCAGLCAGLAVGLGACDSKPSPPPTNPSPVPTPTLTQPPVQPPVQPPAQPSGTVENSSTPSATAPALDGRTFRPSVNGFHFINSFSGSAAPPALREANGGLLGLIKGATEASVGDRFGLCGGMSASAADYFLAGRTPPSTRDVPAEDSTLRNYLFERQVESLGALGLMAAKFVERMALPDVSTRVDGRWTDSAAARTTPELEPILARLDRGELTPLGLVHVRAGAGNAIWENHQVLAYAYESGDGVLTLRVYDPNAPLDDGAVVRLMREGEPGAPEQWRGVLEYGHQADGRMKRRPVRTLFAMPYTPRLPPTE